MEVEERGVLINPGGELHVGRWERGLWRQFLGLLSWVEILFLKQGFQRGQAGIPCEAFLLLTSADHADSWGPVLSSILTLDGSSYQTPPLPRAHPNLPSTGYEDRTRQCLHCHAPPRGMSPTLFLTSRHALPLKCQLSVSPASLATKTWVWTYDSVLANVNSGNYWGWAKTFFLDRGARWEASLPSLLQDTVLWKCNN